MGGPRLTDSGLETWLVFLRGTDLPDFASFPLLDDHDGRALLAEYYRAHLAIAEATGMDLVLETPTWRANGDWGERRGYDRSSLERVNREAVAFLRTLGDEFAGVRLDVSGNLGPRGDGYDPGELMRPDEAAAYHQPQIDAFRAAGADRVTFLTATHAGEAIGVVHAATTSDLPVIISFTVETDGQLPSGQTLTDAITEVDAATDRAALYFGINCAHPDHFASALDHGDDADAIGRLGLLRANASRASHAELDASPVLDDGDPDELAEQYLALWRTHPHLTVVGGCCGTDPRHIDAIARAFRTSEPADRPASMTTSPSA